MHDARTFRASSTFTTLVVCVSIFTDVLLQNLIVPVLPYALSERVGLSSEDEVQKWNSIVLVSFSAAMMVGSLLFGWIGDKIPGRRIPFILGVVVLGASTLCFALGRSLPVLLIARILEGLSTAIICTLGSALLNDAVGADHIGKAMGYTSVALSLGLFIGPVIGGVLYEYAGYFHVFLPAFGLIVIELILRVMIVEPEKGRRDSTDPKVPESSLDAVTVGDERLLQPGMTPTTETEEEQPLMPVIAAQKTHRPAFSILLSSPRFLVAIIGLFILNNIGCGFDGVLTAYINDAFGLNAMHAAALFLAITLPMFLAPIAGTLTDRFGAKWPAAAGFFTAVPSLVLLRLVARGTSLPFVKLAVLLSFVGMALAMAMTPLRAEVSKVVEAMERAEPGIFGPYGAYSQAYGLMNTAVAAGGLLGPLYAGFVRVWFGWGAMSLSMGVLSLIMLVFVLFLTGEKSCSSSDENASRDQ